MHINSIGAGLFSDLSVAVANATGNTLPATFNAAGYHALFGTQIESVGGVPAAGTFVRIINVRDFPAMGNPPQIVNVPVYGQKSSQQIQGQSDAPNVEIVMNFVATDWDADAILGRLTDEDRTVSFRFTLLNSEPSGATLTTRYASTPAGLGTVPNTLWYWTGKIEALMVTPSLSDANQATATISIQSQLLGAFTLAPL